MIQDVTLTFFSAHISSEADAKSIKHQLAKKLSCNVSYINGFVLKKKSLDARHGKIKIHMQYTVYTGEDNPPKEEEIVYQLCDPQKKVVIVGSGPGGLFAALKLLEHGITPIVLERGKSTRERKIDIAHISRNHTVNENSNYCFGEGGAGTFSDGKLFTRSVKRGNPQRIRSIFYYFGKEFFGDDRSVITAAHPHIGTNKLSGIINAMTAKIRSCGGAVLFNCRCNDFIFEEISEGCTKKIRVKGVKAVDTITGEEKTFTGDCVVLATGHSAGDIYELLQKYIPSALEEKTFAAGVRIEHPRSVIDGIQYHGAEKKSRLPAAEYRLTTQVEGRGVYSFCMCPGGLVVPSSSGEEGLVVNGMSPSSRGGNWSNAAIVTEILPEDFESIISDLEKKIQAWEESPVDFEKIKLRNSGVAGSRGLYLRTLLEVLAKLNGDGQRAPAQRVVDFLAGRKSETLPKTTYAPGLISSRLDLWLPQHITVRLKQALVDFEKKMKGFIMPEAVLIAPETRTSTPLRICRDKESFQCIYAENLYPVGEGAGYAGGIVSSAMDGEAAAEAIIKKYFSKN